ncbi:hypothetical protein SprV_0100407700 [Sparganum proliferum]
MAKLTPQNRSTQWTGSPPEAQVAQLQPPPLSRLLTDPTTVGAHGTVPSVPRLIDLPQFRLRRRAPHPPPPQGCQPAPDLKPSGSTSLGPSTKPPMRAFRLQLTGRPSRKRLWTPRHTTITTKLSAYLAPVRSVPLHGCEYYLVHVQDEQKLEASDHRCLRTTHRREHAS